MSIKNWRCQTGHITVNEPVCRLDIELLAIGFHLCYLSRELPTSSLYSSMRNGKAVCNIIHTVTVGLQTKHRESFMVTGDFNHSCLCPALTGQSTTMPFFSPPYRPVFQQRPITVRTVRKWSEVMAVLKGANGDHPLECTV